MADNDLGRAMAYLRGDRTQTEAARLGGLYPATWSLYESGRRRHTESKLPRVLPALGCTRSVS